YTLRATIKDGSNNTVTSDVVTNVTFGFTGITGGASHIVYAPGSNSFTVFADSGTVSFASDLSAGGKTVNLNVAANAIALLNSGQKLAAFTIDAGALVQVPFLASHTVIRATSLTIGATGALDLYNNDLVVDYTGGSSPIATVEGYVATGYNNGTWNGAGIRS